jgi:phosphoglycolate phosphatase
MSINEEILKHIEKFRHVIWDWNGTLVDDLSVAVDSINTLLQENGLSTLTIEKYREVFGFPIPHYYEKVGFDFSKVSFEKLAERYVAEFNHKRAWQAPLFDGVTDVLRTIKSSKTQSILSAAAQWHLDEIIQHHKIEDFFHFRFGIDNHFATTKVHRGRELIKLSGVPAGETILIGDTDHDFEVAQELGISCLLLSDGHQSYRRLASLHDQVLQGRRSF